MNVLTFFWLYYFLNTMLMLTVIYVKKCVVKMNFEKKSFKRVNIYFLGYFSSFIRPGLEILKSSIYSGEQEKKPATRIFYSRVHSNCCFFSMKWHIPTSLKSHAKSICQEAGSRNVKNPYKSCLLAPFLTHHHSSSSILFLNFPPYYLLFLQKTIHKLRPQISSLIFYMFWYMRYL